MRLPLLPVSIVCLLSACAAQQAAAQSLSIVKEGDTGLLIQASAPADERHVLQASKDLNRWLDLDDAVTGTVSTPVPTTRAAQCYFRLIPWVEPAPIRVVLIGDSTVADQASNLGRFCGWGQGLYVYFKANAQVINLAYPGVSTKTFLYSDQKASMLAIKPDYVLIDLFYVDEFNGPPEITTTLEEFEENLRIIIEMIRGFGGTPILLTPQCLYVFNESGKTGPAYPKRIAVVEQLGAWSDPPETVTSGDVDKDVVLSAVQSPAEYPHLADSTSRGRQGLGAVQFHTFRTNSLVEEVHARHGNSADVWCFDGHAESMTKLRLERIGIKPLIGKDTTPGYFP